MTYCEKLYEQVTGKRCSDDDEDRYPCGAPGNPVRIAGKNEDGQEVYAILMPMWV